MYRYIVISQHKFTTQLVQDADYNVERSPQCKLKQESRAIAGSSARCGYKFRYVSKFSVASRGYHCSSNAFELKPYRHSRGSI